MSVRPIILDKSYLQGTSQGRLRKLSTQFQFLMPDVLFYELITSSEPGRSRCFKKLPQKANPIPVVKSVGNLLRKELTTLKPAGLPSENLLKVNYRFNPELRYGSYILPDDVKTAIRESEAELDKDVSMLMDLIALETLFPAIHTGTTEKRKKYKFECEQYIASNIEELSNSLSRFEPPEGTTMPPENILDESWTLLRWFQVRLLFSLDIFWRRGHINISALKEGEKERLEHDVLDMQYLILAILQRAFATRDKKLIEFYNLLCPDGTLMTK